MINTKINKTDTPEIIRDKLIYIMEELSGYLGIINNNIVDVNSGAIRERLVNISANSDQVDTDIASHESTYDHTKLHTRLHGLAGTSDHQGISMDANDVLIGNANGLPATGGINVAELKSCDNHTNGSTNFVLVKQTAEADLNQIISDPPTQAEVQAISDKIDALLVKLRSANVLAT